jgi:ABC-type transport system involved in cytochrome c biogenesis permease subunit
MKQRFKNSALSAMGCLPMIVLLVLAFFVLKGMVWISDKALPWLNAATGLALAVCIVVKT